MAEGTYEYECMRAELLGLDHPNREIFEQEMREKQKVEEEQYEIDLAQEIETQSEESKNTSGKLDELNSILSLTQLKINKFKKACGSLTNLLKIKGGTEEDPANASGTETAMNNADADGASTSKSTETQYVKENNIDSALDTLDAMKELNDTNIIGTKSSTRFNINEKVSSHLSALDSLINKADNAHNAMNHQNKQMKKMI